MNNAEPEPLVRRAWATPVAASVAVGIGGVVLLVGAVFAGDAAGRVLLAVAGVLALGFGVHSGVTRPRLAVTGTGVPSLTVRTLSGTRAYPRPLIARIRIRDYRRLGRRTGQLELDVRDDVGQPDDETRLIIFGRWDLGADPAAVADDLRALGFTVESGRRTA